MNSFELSWLGHKVHLENFFLLHKDNCVRFTIAITCILEVILHAHLIEERNVSHDNSLQQREFVVAELVLGPLPLENEELVLLLFVLYQVFTADYCDKILTFRFCYSNDLICLPSI